MSSQPQIDKLKKLTLNEFAILWWHLIEGLTQTEIGARTGLSKARVSQAFTAIRQKLGVTTYPLDSYEPLLQPFLEDYLQETGIPVGVNQPPPQAPTPPPTPVYRTRSQQFLFDVSERPPRQVLAIVTALPLLLLLLLAAWVFASTRPTPIQSVVAQEATQAPAALPAPASTPAAPQLAAVIPTPVATSIPRLTVTTTPIPPTPSPQASPTPQPTFAPNTLLYTADFTNGWSGGPEWKVVGNKLVNDGTGSTPIFAPFQSPTPDYVVEADISNSGAGANYGLFLRRDTKSTGGYLFDRDGPNVVNLVPYPVPCTTNCGGGFAAPVLAGQRPITGTHRYRLAAMAGDISLEIDGQPVKDLTNYASLNGRISGIYAVDSQLEILSFKISTPDQ